MCSSFGVDDVFYPVYQFVARCGWTIMIDERPFFRFLSVSGKNVIDIKIGLTFTLHLREDFLRISIIYCAFVLANHCQKIMDLTNFI